jgi:hypothetical protein
MVLEQPQWPVRRCRDFQSQADGLFCLPDAAAAVSAMVETQRKQADAH